MTKRWISSIVILCICAGMLFMTGKKEPVSAMNEYKEAEIVVADDVAEPEASVELVEEVETNAEKDVTTKENEIVEPVELLAESEPADVFTAEEHDTSEEYMNLAIARVNHYVNVRREPNTESEIVGKMYNGSVAQVISVAGEEEDWLQVISGNVEGYIKAEYFICGEEALLVIEDYVIRYVQVQADKLNVRKEPDVQSKKIGYLLRDEKAKLVDVCNDWCKILYADEKEGYVSAEYVLIAEEYIYAKSIEEENAEKKAREEALARQKALDEEKQKAEQKDEPKITPNTEYSSNEELRQQIVDYAMQYLGNAYINGGKSLETGTDCSGFTCFIYRDFGYSISRTPSGQYKSDGRSIDYADIRKGDILCYSSNGSSCTHVALYIGDGQIIHAANSRKGVIIGRADYSPIIAVKNIID